MNVILVIHCYVIRLNPVIDSVRALKIYRINPVKLVYKNIARKYFCLNKIGGRYQNFSVAEDSC